MRSDKAIESPKDLILLLKDPAKGVALLAGMIERGPKTMVGAAMRLVQATIGRTFFQQLSREVRDFIDAGKIKDNFSESPHNPSIVL